MFLFLQICVSFVECVTFHLPDCYPKMVVCDFPGGWISTAGYAKVDCYIKLTPMLCNITPWEEEMNALAVNVGSKVLVFFIHIKEKDTRTMEWVTEKRN